MGEGVKGKIQNLLTRAREKASVFRRFPPAPNTASRRLEDRARSSIIRSAESIATAAAPLCCLAHRVPTRIEAVRNKGCDTASTLVSATETMRFKKNDVRRALGPNGHSV